MLGDHCLSCYVFGVFVVHLYFPRDDLVLKTDEIIACVCSLLSSAELMFCSSMCVVVMGAR